MMLRLAAVAVVSLPLVCLAHTFHYEAKIPSSNLGCQAEATKLAARMSSIYHVQSPTGRCEQVVHANFDGAATDLFVIRVDYQAKQPLSLYQAQIGGMVDMISPSAEDGSFHTYADCLQNRDEQMKTFGVQTGLAPIASRCDAEEGVLPLYKMTVDGFGKPKRQMQVLHLDFGWWDDTVVGQMTSMLNGMGAHIARRVDDAVLYYGGKDLPPFVELSIAYFKSAANCQTQVEPAMAIIHNADAHAISHALCLVDPRTGGEHPGLFVFAKSRAYLESEALEHKYDSFAECLADRPRILKEAGQDLAGVICADDDFSSQLYQMILFRY